MERKMRSIRLIIFSCCFLTSKGRSLETRPENAKTTPEPDPSLVDSMHSPRVIRQIRGTKIFNKGSLIDDISPIFVYNSKMRPASNRRILVRDPRDNAESDQQHIVSHKVENDHKQKDHGQKRHEQKDRQVLVKSPIQKFQDLDYESEFQKHLDRISMRHGVDSGWEEEDEDFNLDDYDFDVNHDEFIAQGKLLEPKVKVLENLVIADLPYQKEQAFKETMRDSERPVVKQYRTATYKPGLKDEEDYDVRTFAPGIDMFDGDNFKKVVNNKFTIFGGSPKYSLLLVPWW